MEAEDGSVHHDAEQTMRAANARLPVAQTIRPMAASATIANLAGGISTFVISAAG
jgi:hypothetical protein